MNLDRPVTLDLSTGGLDARAAGQQSPGGQAGGQEADAQDREAFERALAGQAAASAAKPEAPAASPFALFGRAVPPSSSAAPAPDGAPLARELEGLVSQFAVGDGRSGGALVRMELDESVLPGVSVEIEEAEGRLQVTFTCSVERSRQRLMAELPARGPVLAAQLGREVLLRVQADDPDDPCLYELLASA